MPVVTATRALIIFSAGTIAGRLGARPGAGRGTGPSADRQGDRGNQRRRARRSDVYTSGCNTYVLAESGKNVTQLGMGAPMYLVASRLLRRIGLKLERV